MIRTWKATDFEFRVFLKRWWWSRDRELFSALDRRRRSTFALLVILLWAHRSLLINKKPSQNQNQKEGKRAGEKKLEHNQRRWLWRSYLPPTHFKIHDAPPKGRGGSINHPLQDAPPMTKMLHTHFCTPSKKRTIFCSSLNKSGLVFIVVMISICEVTVGGLVSESFQAPSSSV